jgi:hypothetical protein
VGLGGHGGASMARLSPYARSGLGEREPPIPLKGAGSR